MRLPLADFEFRSDKLPLRNKFNLPLARFHLEGFSDYLLRTVPPP
jgi:hypothetical protein